MKSNNLQLRFVGPTLLVTLCCASAMAAEDAIQREFIVQPGGTFVLESEGGSVDVRTGSDTLLRVEVRNPDDMVIDFEQSGNDVYVTVENEGRRSRIRTQYIIEVPEQFNLDLQTQGGSMDIDDRRGNVKAQTAGGSIEIGNVIGQVDAQTAGGSVTVGRVTGDVMTQTAGGSISIGDATGNVSAQTAGGSITVHNVEGRADLETAGGSITGGFIGGMAYADTAGGSIELVGSGSGVEAQTAGGSITVERSQGPVSVTTAGGSIELGPVAGAINARTAGGSIEAILGDVAEGVDTTITLATSGGDVELTLPGNHRGTVDAHIEVSRRYRGDYRIYTDFPLTITGEEDRDVIGRGDINGGGDRIRLETTNGDITIRRRD